MCLLFIPINWTCRVSEEADSQAYDSGSQSIIKLSNGTVLYLRAVNKYLALVAQFRSENFEKHGLVDYNFGIFRKAISDVFKNSI
jgi:Ras-related GTP-binding protein C/D